MRKIVTLLSVAGLLFANNAYAIETNAKQAIMMDAATHTIIFEKNGEELMHPSSMSKLMTLYILFQRIKEGRLKLDSKFSVSENAWRMQGSKMFVPLGEEITVENLIHGIVIQSGNDACIVVAEGISGSEDAFAKEMNRVGKDIGLKHSHFVNSTGMPDEKHLMSAHDLAVLSDRLIEDFPEYYHYFALKEYTYNKIAQQNRNRLLGTIGVDGLKTGHTEAGGYGIALSARQGDRRLILVINGLGNDDERVKEGDALLRYGFREFENKTLIRKGQQIGSADVWFGKKGSVPLIARDDVTVTVPVAATKGIRYTLKYDGPLQAPVTKDTPVGMLYIRISDDLQPFEVPLLAGENVEKLSGLKHMLAVLRHYLSSKSPVSEPAAATP